MWANGVEENVVRHDYVCDQGVCAKDPLQRCVIHFEKQIEGKYDETHEAEA